MSIIKTAFQEGRESDVSWDDSETNKKLKLLELKTHNIRIINSEHERYKKKKIQQICPNTGDCLNVFSSVSQAARHLLLSSNKVGYAKRKYQMAGNMRMCMLNGHKSYGYYWKILPHDSKEAVTTKYESMRKPKKSANNYVVIDLKNGQVTHTTKIREVSKIVGEPLKSIEHILYDTTGYGATINNYIVESRGHFEKISLTRKIS